MFKKYTYDGRKGDWLPVEETELDCLTFDELAARDANFVTVLSISDDDPPLYKGPYYLDIDSKNIIKAIAAVKAVLNKLLAGGVDKSAIRVWASGKKGFHVVIPACVFSDGAPDAELPLIYKEMTHRLTTSSTVDKSVYSMGRGRVWRVENIQRPDNGKFKVPLTVDEMLRMTQEIYESVTSKPRLIEWPDAPPYSEYLASIFDRARFEVENTQQPEPMLIDPEVEEKLGGRLPDCMSQLRQGKNIKPRAGFNNVSLQFAKGMAHFSPKDFKKAAEDFTKNVRGDNYNTVQKRRAHFNSAYAQVLKQPGRYAFDCNYMRNVLENPPCKECPLYEPSDEAVTSSEARAEGREINASSLVGLLTTPDGYCFIGEKGENRLVANFTLKLSKEYLEHSQSMQEDRRVALIADVFIHEEYAGKVQLEESNWVGKSSFLNAFLGIKNASFFGSDADVQKIKSALLSGDTGMTQIVRVHTAGVFRRQVADETMFAYAEPGWSIDSTGEQDKYFVSGKLPVMPQLKSVELPEPGDTALKEAVAHMLNINTPRNMGNIIGWFMACFLKQHFEYFIRQFPLLNLSGNAGAGKTLTASTVAMLHGVDYVLEEGPIGLESVTTMFPIWNFIASSTTVPRLLDEFNRSRLSTKHYNEITGILKSTWSSHSVSRGTIGGNKVHGSGRMGANTIEIPLTGPVVYMSEQAPELPAIVDRTVQVQMTREQRLSDPGKEESFNYVHRNRHVFAPLAKAFNMRAIMTTTDQVEEIRRSFEDKVPRSIGNRPHFSYTVVLTGLRFMRDVLNEYGIDLSEKLQELEDAVLKQLVDTEEAVALSKLRSEVDLVIEKMGVMAAMSSPAQEWIEPGRHYIVVGEYLYLDLPVAHSLYIRYANMMERQAPAIGTLNHMRTYLAQESYCVAIETVLDGFVNNRKVAQLSIEGLEKKGIDTSMFRREA